MIGIVNGQYNKFTSFKRGFSISKFMTHNKFYVFIISLMLYMDYNLMVLWNYSMSMPFSDCEYRIIRR